MSAQWAGDRTTWDPEQYNRFKTERTLPFRDLLALVEPCPGARVIDLGCGTGELTRELHAAVGAHDTLGIDSSPVMLERASGFAGDGVHFEAGDIATWRAESRYDVVFSNAALHWVADHRELIPRLRDALVGGGELAVQVPANADHPSHVLGLEVAAESPFREALERDPPPDPGRNVLTPGEYAELLHELGFTDQHVRLQVYGHRLVSTDEVVEWAKGTHLTYFRARLPDDVYAQYVDRYRRRLLDRLGERRPYFYAFKRILFWARLPRGAEA